MLKKMDVRIDISKGFDKDLGRFSSQEQFVVKNKLNYLIDVIKSGTSSNQLLYRLHKIQLIGNLESSLYILKVNKDIRIILTSESDPLFDEHILTLLKIVRHGDLDKSFKSITESLYQSLINRKGEENG